MARLSLALPLFERCERPSTASVRPCRLQPGRLAQGPDEKCGTDGRTPGIAMLIHLPFQIAASAELGFTRFRPLKKSGRSRIYPTSAGERCPGNRDTRPDGWGQRAVRAIQRACTA